MGIYLDKLRSTLNDVQSKHITNLLHKQRNTGEISNLEQFRTRLGELTKTILADQLSPSLQVFFSDFNQLIDSATFDFMLDRIRDDLETVFSELNTLDDVADSHINIVNNVVLKAIKLGVNELENKISLYELLAGNTDGFTKSLFNTFSAAQDGRTYRTSPDVGILFQDPRLKNVSEEDVAIDTVGEKITLGADYLTYVPIKSISQIFDNEATQSEDIVAFASSDIKNVITGGATYWTYSILQNQINSDGVTAKFELDLGVGTDINFIEIESAALFPMELVKIEYLNPNGTYSNINIFETLVNRNIRISFAKVNARKIHLVVRQMNALEVQYENKNITDNWDAVIAKEKASGSVDSIANALHDTIKSSTLLETAFMVQNIPTGKQVKYFDYTVGFDSIKVGYGEFADSSIFVSSQITVNNLQQLGLKTKELRPLETSGIISLTDNTNPSIDVGYFHGSIEYNAVLQNFNDKDQLIDIDIVPLLPTGESYINHERLLLVNTVGVSQVPNSGVLRFYTPHFNDLQKAAIKVYRNGTLLTIGYDWIFEDFPFTNDFVPPNGQPNTVGIRILNPSKTDFFTVSYAPLASNTKAHPLQLDNINLNFDKSTPVPIGINVVDLVGDASATMDKDNIINISDQKHNGQVVAYTKVNISIILRRNSINLNLTSSVDEYTLLLHNGE